MPDLPTFREWPQDAGPQTPARIVQMYAAGLRGAHDTPAEKERLRDFVRSRSGILSGDAVCHRFNLAMTGAGKLVVPYVHILDAFPGSCPGPAQERGDCVSHSTKNAALLTLACEIAAALPDEVTGIVEGIPDLDDAGIRNGVLSSEWPYWFRGYNGDGWQCSIGCRVTLENGIMLRKKYAGIDLDLSAYSGRLAGRYGSKPPPPEFVAVGREHLIRTLTEADSDESTRDLLANGHGISSCGGEGFASTRDANGVSARRGSWAHAMLIAGFDDRADTRSLYGDSLQLIGNSWGPNWNGGPRDIRDSARLVPASKRQRWIDMGLVNGSTGNLLIPEGYFWAKSTDVRRRDKWAFAGAHGWRRKQLPDYLANAL